jgi:ABC-2 type transport system permease protein
MRHARAIVWAQFRTLVNFYSKGHTGALIFTALLSTMWYAISALAAVGVAIVMSQAERMDMIAQAAPRVLVFMFGYWQVVPLLLASTGAGLDLRRLVVYPIRVRELFAIEVLLRVTTSIEMMCISAGAAAGILLNPRLPLWSLGALGLWVAFNLLLSAGLRNLLGRVLARRGARELLMIAFVLLLATPQLLLVSGIPDSIEGFLSGFAADWWPWQVAARLITGSFDPSSALALVAWTAAAYWFGRLQFIRGLSFDAEAAAATVEREVPTGWADRVYRLPGLALPDPLGAIVEKEIRFLSRAPRFRLVFLMGFTFGLLIWLPLAFRGGPNPEGFFASNYLTFVTIYALMLLGEVSFWNTFGFDREAVQIYYLLPVPFGLVLLAKNLAALIFVFLEITAIAIVCALVGMPLTPGRLLESYAIALVLTILLLGIGNLGSTYYPRPVNPAHSWRSSSAGKFQALMMLTYPVLSFPVALAYLARYAFESHWAFYTVLAIGGAVGLAFYWVATDSAVQAARARKEHIVEALSQGEGPLAA